MIHDTDPDPSTWRDSPVITRPTPQDLPPVPLRGEAPGAHAYARVGNAGRNVPRHQGATTLRSNREGVQ